MRHTIITLLLSAGALLIPAGSSEAQDISVKSSYKALEKEFEWAKAKARSFVMTGKTGEIDTVLPDPEAKTAVFIPSYWAGYPLRTAFYSRDFCHQAAGAHLLGLTEENFTMLKAFAGSANAARKWYPLWALNFDGSPYYMDYRGDDNFVREVPATFELVEKAWQLYLWTGDRRYIEDEVLWNYYKKALTDFISLHDTHFPNGVAEGTGEGNIFKGTATFNEQRDVRLFEAGDGIACQYAAYLALSKMAEAKGEKKLSKEMCSLAKDLKRYFLTEWGVSGTDTYNRGYATDGRYVAGWGKENSWFMPMKGITDASSPRNAKYLDFISERLDSKDDIPVNIEAVSYVPEIYFAYNRNEEGWKWLRYILDGLDQSHSEAAITGTNGNYPEVSYIIVSNVVEGLAGVAVSAAEGRISTASHLPEDVADLEVSNIVFGDSVVSVSHKGQESSSLSYSKGSGTISWEARFAGEHRYLFVNGKRCKAKTVVSNGASYSFCSIKLSPGQSAQVSLN